MKLFAVYIAFFSCAMYFAHATPSACDSESEGTLVSVTIPGCDNDDARCVLHKGTNATVEITFTTKEAVKTVTALVFGIVMNVPVPFALPNPDGCLDSGLTCPLEASTTYTYSASLPVLRKYPKLNVDVKWQLQNEEEKDIVCAIIPASVE